MEKNKIYIDIINETLDEKYGTKLFEVSTSDEIIDIIQIQSRKGFTFYMENGNYVINLPFLYDKRDYYGNYRPLRPIPINNLEFFKYILNIVIEKELSHILIDCYEGGILKELPKCLKQFQIKYDLSKLSEDIFVKYFNEATEDESNGEKCDVLMYAITENGIEIEFEVDCGRWGVHDGGRVSISTTGRIYVTLPEIIEGGGVEDELIEKLKNFFESK
jgi:hypothetical protein